MPDEPSQQPGQADDEPTRFRVADTGWPLPSGPEAARSGWVTSPPPGDEPWAGPPAAAPVAATPPAVEPDKPTARESRAETGTEPHPEPTIARSSGRRRGQHGRHGRPGRTVFRRRARHGDGSPPADATGSTDAARARRPRWPATRLAALAVAIVVVLVFGFLDLRARVWPGPSPNPYTSSSTRAAIAAATAVAAPILSYDYTSIDQKAATLAPLQTTTCASQYAQLITSTVKPLAVQNKASQQATVLAAGVSSASKRAVTVLAFVQLTSTNSVKTGKEINEAQISVSMVNQDGKWLLAGTSANGASDASTPSCGGATSGK